MDRRPARDKADPVSAMLHRNVRVHPAVRVAMAMIVLIGGASLVLLGILIPIMTSQRPVPHPIGVVLVALGLVASGCGFLYVGWWLLLGKDDSTRLVGARGQMAFGVVAGATAIGTMFAAWQADSVLPAIQALGIGVLSWVLLRSSTSQENG